MVQSTEAQGRSVISYATGSSLIEKLETVQALLSDADLKRDFKPVEVVPTYLSEIKTRLDSEKLLPRISQRFDEHFQTAQSLIQQAREKNDFELLKNASGALYHALRGLQLYTPSEPGIGERTI